MNSITHGHYGSSTRRVSASSLRTEQSLKVFQGGNEFCPSRTQALSVAKRYAVAIGLKAAKIALIDQLFAFSPAIDWASSSDPKLVWPTNEHLARRLGIKISTLKYHLAGLVEAMLIHYSDHPTYQRKGRRDKDGRMVEGYGIDLSPIAARYDDLLEVASAAEAKAKEMKKLSYLRTNLRRQIEGLISRALVEEAHEKSQWSTIIESLEAIRSKKPTNTTDLALVVADLVELKETATKHLQALLTEQNLDPTQTNFRPLQATEELSNNVGNDNRNCANAQYNFCSHAYGEMAYEKGLEKKSANSKQPPENREVSFVLIRSAMTELAELLPDIFDSWTSFRNAGLSICSLCYINPQVYWHAVTELGRDRAAIALALTAERTAKGVVENPGAYLRALIDRGRDGKLRLDRSLHALASGQPTDNGARRPPHFFGRFQAGS